MDDRLNPGLGHPSFLVRVAIRDAVVAFPDALRSRPDGTTVLDIGCWKAPYRDIFTARGLRHVGFDIANHGGADVVGPTCGLSFRDMSVDAIICTQVLQEADSPVLLIAEMRRVLKRGGRLLLTTPGAYSMYSDRDRWRWSAAGLRELFADWDDVTVTPQGGGVQCCLQLAMRTLAILAGQRPRRLGAIRAIAVPLMNLIAPRIDRALYLETLTVNYAVSARRR